MAGFLRIHAWPMASAWRMLSCASAGPGRRTADAATRLLTVACADAMLGATPRYLKCTNSASTQRFTSKSIGLMENSTGVSNGTNGRSIYV